MATITEPPLIVIVGPTASGKTSLSLELAQKLDGEIICADSRTIYKGMDIGTAKPTTDEQGLVPHWGLDLVEPSERFTVADFKVYVVAAITDIRSRGKIPLLVGGSGLYIDAVVFDYEFGRDADAVIREKLDQLSIEELLDYCIENNIILPRDTANKRRLIRVIEQNSISTKRQSKPSKNSIIVGIATNKTILNERIAQRTEHLFTNGVVEEATMLGDKYGWNHESMTGNIYPLIRSYLENALTLAEVKEKFTTLDRQLAKRQMTWFRRNPYIEWCTLPEAYDHVVGRLAAE